MSKKNSHPRPPQPPPFQRRAQFHLLQRIGVPLLFVLPVLALFGVFGESFTEARASTPVLQLQLHYPSRTRYRLDSSMQLQVRNISKRPLATVSVGFDQDYLESFADVSFTPNIDTVSEGAYRLLLRDLQPGETRTVSVSFLADAYGSHRGTITATAASGEPAEIAVRTFVFP